MRQETQWTTIFWEGWTALALCAAAVFWPGSAALGYPAVLWPGLALAAAIPVLRAKNEAKRPALRVALGGEGPAAARGGADGETGEDTYCY